jgi:hypothetical protein
LLQQTVDQAATFSSQLQLPFELQLLAAETGRVTLHILKFLTAPVDLCLLNNCCETMQQLTIDDNVQHPAAAKRAVKWQLLRKICDSRLDDDFLRTAAADIQYNDSYPAKKHNRLDDGFLRPCSSKACTYKKKTAIPAESMRQPIGIDDKIKTSYCKKNTNTKKKME